MYQYLIPFNGWGKLYFVNTPLIIYSSVDGCWAVSIFLATKQYPCKQVFFVQVFFEYLFLILLGIYIGVEFLYPAIFLTTTYALEELLN